MNEPLVAALVAVAIMLLIGFPIHEFSHALAAHRLGDDTARWQGRLTLDPRVHFEPLGGAMLAISALLSNGSFFFGYARPTPVNPMNLQGGRRGEALVAAAGPISNLVMAAVVAIPVRYVLATPELMRLVYQQDVARLLLDVAFYFVVINVFLCLFNLIPIPPLDGWHVLLGLSSPRWHYELREFERRYATIIPIVFIAFILLGGARILRPISDALLRLLLGT